MMLNARKTGRLQRVALTILVVVGLAVSQPIGAGADDKLGESAIDSAMDQLSPEPEPEQSDPPPAEEGTAEPAPAESAPAESSDQPAPPAEEPPAENPPAAEGNEAAVSESAGEPAPQSAGAGTDTSAPTQVEQAATTDTPAATGGISPEQAATDALSNYVDVNAASGEPTGTDASLAAAAASNVLRGESALGGSLPVNGDDQQASGGSDSNGGSNERSTGAAGDNAPRQATTLQAAGNDMRSSTISPRRGNGDRGERRGDDNEDNGTVVVNNLSDAGDQGKLAVHGRFVAGTLCDGSQFWSLDGGGTVNANGINLSANGGTAASDASGGEDNVGLGGGAAGNGGTARSSADGGIVVVQELVTGNNRGNEVTVGDQAFTGDCGQGVIDGGDATTINNVNVSADGGVALADASGGDNNLAAGDGAGAGNGGRANASADGGIVIVGSLILGNNEGNTINAGGSGSGGSGSGGSSSGGCLIDGGTVRNVNNIDISADGGAALADASGGDDNVALGDDAGAGNGGRATANADGGIILAGDIITGNNSGNTINAECGGGGGGGRVVVNGGTVLNRTNLTLSADGGTAIADASGGDDNIAGGFGGDAAAGNGGRAESNAAGGMIQVGNIVTGNNTGNVIALGANFAPVPGRDGDAKKQDGVRKIQQPAGGQSKPAGGGGKKGAAVPAGRATKGVGTLPNTGTGDSLVAGSQAATVATLAASLAIVAALGVGAARRRQPRAVAAFTPPSR